MFKDELRRVAEQIFEDSQHAINVDQMIISIAGYMNTLMDSYLEQHSPDYYSLLKQAKKYNSEGKLLYRQIVQERQEYWKERQEVLSQIDDLAEEKAREKVKDLLQSYIDGTLETW